MALTLTAPGGSCLSSRDFQPVLVVPVFNHGPAFAGMLPRLQQHGLPIIAVDDGSEEETRSLLTALAARHDELHVIRNPTNVGKGGAVICGIRAAAARGYSHVLQIDADGQHDAGDITRFLDQARAHPDAAITGVPRFDDSIPRSRRLARYLTHVWVWVETLSLGISDSMCGFRIYPLRIVEPLLDNPWLGRRMDFDPEILVRLHWLGARIIEIPTRVTYPAGGRSNFKLVRDNALITAMHTRLVLGMVVRSPRLLWSRMLRRRERHG